MALQLNLIYDAKYAIALTTVYVNAALFSICQEPARLFNKNWNTTNNI